MYSPKLLLRDMDHNILFLNMLDVIGSWRLHYPLEPCRKMYKTGYLMVDRNGSSIDRGHVRNRKDVTIFSYDTARERGSRDEIVAADLALYFSDYENPEETALFNTDYSKFVDNLTVRERAYWDARLEGIIWKDIERLKIADRNQQPGIRRSIREKFREWLDS